jgi:hypothetical protein
MRASLFLAGLAATSLLGAGAIAVGCSSSSSGSPAASDDASTATDAPATTPDTGTEDAPATSCTPMYDASVATVATPDVPGMASFSCLQGKCGPSLTACAADCTCNNDLITALLCLAPPDGGTLTACFGPVLSSSNSADSAVLGCLQTNMSACTAGDGGTTGDASPDAGPTEAGADAGDGG